MQVGLRKQYEVPLKVLIFDYTQEMLDRVEMYVTLIWY